MWFDFIPYREKKIISENITNFIFCFYAVFKSAICDQCGKAFATASKLKKHMTMHTDDRPYECEICNKT